MTADLGTQIFELSLSSKESIRKLSEGNLYNPHVFGLDARELFFQEDRIVLTEGQEDVLLYPKVAEQVGASIPGSFFGWGAGGAGNIEQICRILQDLGFKKVGGLLDGDKASEVERLSREFPGFFFAAIPAKDIRTKPGRSATSETEGLLDGNLEIRTEFKGKVKSIFDALFQHMHT